MPVQTYNEPYDYRLATAFMLAHDYGVKRVMSSYNIVNNDNGPPASAASCDSIDWICEHRFKTIGEYQSLRPVCTLLV